MINQKKKNQHSDHSHPCGRDGRNNQILQSSKGISYRRLTNHDQIITSLANCNYNLFTKYFIVFTSHISTSMLATTSSRTSWLVSQSSSHYSSLGNKIQIQIWSELFPPLEPSGHLKINFYLFKPTQIIQKVMFYSESENLKHDEELNIIFKKQEQKSKNYIWVCVYANYVTQKLRRKTLPKILIYSKLNKAELSIRNTSNHKVLHLVKICSISV